MTILGPKLLSSDNREGFLGNTIDNIFWQVRDKASSSQLVNSLLLITHSPHHLSVQSLMLPLTSSASPLTMYFNSQNKSYIFENSPSFSKNSAGTHKTYTHTQNTLSAPLPAFAVPLHSFFPPFLDLSLKGKETCWELSVFLYVRFLEIFGYTCVYHLMCCREHYHNEEFGDALFKLGTTVNKAHLHVLTLFLKIVVDRN